MPEEYNIEIAQKLAEYETDAAASRRLDLLEITEAVVLALIAVATAWSGYQAAKWDGHQALLYGHASKLRVESSVAAIEGAQQRLLDVVQSNEWIRAHDAKNQQLADAYRDRLSAEYRVAFEAWLKTNPLTNPDAPSGPTAMPEYRNALLEKAAELNKEAAATFTEGTQARAVAESYVRSTVLLATVLFLVAVAQRFKIRSVRRGLLLVASTVMIYALVHVAMFPRL
ncbi:MAG: hypothetical protein K2Y71_26900 [Xanthobacteraceae bacterium]|nr:hypothetical protein [Xanthobacteraceae bacterium]